MESKNCWHGNIEKNVVNFYNKHTECKICNSNRSLKRYYENKENLSNERKVYYEKIDIDSYKIEMIDIKVIKNDLNPMLN